MSAQSGAGQDATNRPVVVHYHLFKNAGTSVDAALRSSFGGAWAEKEFAPPDGGGMRPNAEQIGAFIAENPNLSAISSHTALLPVPVVKGVDVYPVLFIRHPIDRMRSAYEFERQQKADTFGARLAKETDMAGYIRALLDLGTHRGVRNFQVLRLSFNESGAAGSELDRARRAVDSLPFVGLVEAFEQSMLKMETYLKPRFPNFSSRVFRRNVSQTMGSTLASRLSSMCEELGDALYAELLDCNADDMVIFQMVSERYDFAMQQVA